MLKTKVLICGVAMQLVIFMIFMSLTSFVAINFGNIQSPSYILALEISSYVSVIVSGFLTARIAWERGSLYGIIIAVAFFVVRLITAFAMGSDMEVGVIFTKFVIIVLAGFLSGALGVSGSKDKKYFT